MDAASRIDIYYKSEDIQPKLDEGFEVFLRKLGYERWASGYEFRTSRRNISFERIDVK